MTGTALRPDSTALPPGGRGAAPVAPYDPSYDPLVAADPGQGRDYAPTYWAATAGPPPADDGPVCADMDVDVAIIGSGFTGLATALFLAEEHGIRATVLEANQVAWGCTSRNGGQGQNASGRLSRSQWLAKWGKDVALALDAEIGLGFETFRSLVARVDCDAQSGGHLYIAHRQAKLESLAVEARVRREVFNHDVRILSAGEVRERYVDDRDSHGALHEPDGIGVHPLKLAYGYARMARAAGARIHTSSPVLDWTSSGDRHYLRTPGGTVRARTVAVATGGYTSQGLSALLRNRVMPILSNSIVTRPLTAAELEATRFQTREVITDTRTLRFYYRRLPDDRVQIGSRSAIHGRDASAPRHLDLLRTGLQRKFPALRDIEVDYSWWGWVDVSHDMMPRIVQPDPARQVFYALGYGGNGVSFSAHAGRRMAQHIAGRGTDVPALPIYGSALPGHPFAAFRRLGQAMLYRWYHLRDEYL
jgi:glycine/D-amino acid oxidase-like deaminating enzyme